MDFCVFSEFAEILSYTSVVSFCLENTNTGSVLHFWDEVNLRCQSSMIHLRCEATRWISESTNSTLVCAYIVVI